MGALRVARRTCQQRPSGRTARGARWTGSPGQDMLGPTGGATRGRELAHWRTPVSGRRPHMRGHLGRTPTAHGATLDVEARDTLALGLALCC